MLSEEQKILLKEIVTNKMSVGAFSGMIFNAKTAHPEEDIEDLVSTALNVRLTMESMIR